MRNELSNIYKSPKFFSNGNIQTLYPHFFRKVPPFHYQRERILTPDGDFLDLDWNTCGSKNLVILSHGLEGSTQAKYILGMGKILSKNKFDVLAWNNRSCGGLLNKKEIFYHSGATYDLDSIIEHVTKTHDYNSISLVGFSLGGNVTLKYLGEKSTDLNPKIKAAIGISVPIDLKSCQLKLDSFRNLHYRLNFLVSLKKKVIHKMMRGDLSHLDKNIIKKINSIWEYDNYITGPLHGFSGAEHYYKDSSSLPYLNEIQIPCLLINAENDPFLGENCYISKTLNKNLTHLTPKSGGHVGFISFDKSGELWTEKVAAKFLEEHSKT